MKLKYVYLALCFLGALIPYASFFPWLAQNGLNVPLLITQIISSPVASFGWLDVIISALALFAFILIDRREHPTRHAWLAVLGTLVVGVSLGLPLYLFLRETARPN